MRYDDMVATALAWPDGAGADQARMWRQLIDLAAQGRVDEADAGTLCARLRQLRTAVPEEMRVAAADRLARAPVGPDILKLFAEEPAAILAPLFASAALSAEQWHGLLPELPSRALRILSQRRDLPPAIALAVARPVANPPAPLPAPLAPPDEPATGDQIRELLTRIEAFRSRARADLALPEQAGFDEMVGALRQPLDALTSYSGPPPTSGPAAAEVVQRSLELMAAVDDYDAAAAAIEGIGAGRVDAATMLQRLHAAFLPVASARGVLLGFRIVEGLPPPAADPSAVERLFARLLGSVLGLARTGERFAVRLGRDRANGPMIALSVARPGRLAGRDEARLLASELVGDGLPDAPLMALSFTLRLVRSLAEEVGGRLEIGHDRLLLLLPVGEPQRAVRLATAARAPLSHPGTGGL